MKRIFLITSWALYDLANQFFALNVVSLYFVRWLTLEKNAPEVFYSIAFSLSMLLVAFFAPILGTISDMNSRHRPFLIFFTVLSIIFTMSLGAADNVLVALSLFAVANFGCQEAVVFYNALMVRVSPKNKIGLVSGLGKMCGYLGAILALYFTKPVILEKGYHATFFLTGILFLLFSLPCMLFIKEPDSYQVIAIKNFFRKDKILAVFRRLRTTFIEGVKIPGLLNFFKAAFFSLGVVNILILFMSVYASKVFFLTEAEIINLIAFSTLFAIGASIGFGFLSDFIGYRSCLIFVFFLWILCLLSGSLMRPPFHWFTGALVGTSLGSLWVVSRALVIKLVPEDKIGEMFGLFTLVSYSSAIVGALYWGLIMLYLAPFGEIGYRIGLFSLVVFMLLALVFLLRIPKGIKDS